jgi:hypothetical protein
MRYLPLGLALLSAQAYGQVVYQETPNFPLRPPTPRQYSLNAPPVTGGGLTEPGVGLPFRNWQELLAKSAFDAQLGRNLKRGSVIGWAAGGHCSVPLLEMPLPEHFDEPMVMKVPPHPDDKMAITPPPVCPLRGARANPPKRK